MNDRSCPGPLKTIQRSAQVRHSAAGARPSRRGTNAQHPGDLIEAEPPLVMEQQRFCLIGGQRRNTSADLVPRSEACRLPEARGIQATPHEIRELLPIAAPLADSSGRRFAPNRTPMAGLRMPDCKRPSTGASEETSPAANRPRCPSRPRDGTGTAALRLRVARRSPETLPAIRPDNGSSTREVGLLLRSLLGLFAGRDRFVTGTSKKLSHSKSCHTADVAGKSRNRGQANSRPKSTQGE